MADEPGADAVTVAEAARRLGRTQGVVFQLRKAGHLRGPELPEGRRRFPANAPSIWVRSLNAEIESRIANGIDVPKEPIGQPQAASAAAAQFDARGDHRAGDGRVDEAPDPNDDSAILDRAMIERLLAREAGAMAAVLEMKIQLDIARESLTQRRERQRKMKKTLKRLVKQIGEDLTYSVEFDALAGGYSNALTQLAIPEPPTRGRHI